MKEALPTTTCARRGDEKRGPAGRARILRHFYRATIATLLLLHFVPATPQGSVHAQARGDALAVDQLEAEAKEATNAPGAAGHAMGELPALLPPVAPLQQDLTPLAEAIPQLLRALPAVPALLGLEEPHTYLVLVQNNHELRPTGGFITAVGRITLDKGRISEMDFTDSYSIFRDGSDYPSAPRPMQEYMQIPYLTFRDTNWSPDLATTAEIARTIYAQDTRKEFDSVITIDLNAVQGIIGALSPLSLSGIETAVTGENIVEIMKQLWARPADSQATSETDIGQWWRERKDFIPKLAQAALDKVLSGEADLLAMASAVVTALNQRDIQLLVTTPEAAAAADLFSDMGWDGALAPAQSNDFLALIDMNMGYNKADAVVDRTLSHSVTWPAAGGAPEATTVVTYTHTFTGTPNLCAPEPKYGTDYDDMIERCYFNYVRLFVPAGSELLSVDGVEPDSVSSQRSEKGTLSLAGYFSLEPGQQKTVTFRYRLPEEIAEETYALRIQRQSGTDTLPLRLSVGDWSGEFLLENGRLEIASSAGG